MTRGFRSPLFVPTLAFLGTALIGVWAAYDRGAAWGWFGLLALGITLTVGIPWAVRHSGESALGMIGLGCASLAAAVGAYFLLEYDWATRGPGPFAMLQQAGLWIQAHRPAVPLPEDIHRNVAGAALAITLPLGWGGWRWAWAQGRRVSGAVGALALSLALVALILTASRGAWIGLAAGALTAGILDRGGYALLRGAPRWSRLALFSGAGLVLLGGFWTAVTWPGLGPLLGAVPAGGAMVSRAGVWRHMLTLARDYAFTGSGLGSTPMVYSTYALLLHVPYITHAHNLFLQIAVQQGLPGLAAFLWLVALGMGGTVSPHSPAPSPNPSTALRTGPGRGGVLRRPRGSPEPPFSQDWEKGGWGDEGLPVLFRTAALASLIALAVHGMADAGLYVSRLVPIIFLPIGVALALCHCSGRSPTHRSGRSPFGPNVSRQGHNRHAQDRPDRASQSRSGRSPTASAVRRRTLILWQVAAILALAALLFPGPRAVFQADLGAVAQTRAELSVYPGPAWPIQDALRRSPDVDLASAIARYQAALVLNPADATANRRLGQIELSAGAYEAARQHLEAAYAAAPDQPVTRQLLGESYAVAGDVATAAALWRPLDLSQGQLDLRRWWYNHIGEPERAAWIAQAAELAGEMGR